MAMHFQEELLRLAMRTAPVNKIIEFSNVDGPSNRTSIFFQSCNFNCQYCHNPETINYCVGCGECVGQCPAKALSIENNKVLWNKELCCGCDTCIKVCKHNASPKISHMSVDDVIEKIKETRPYIKGITTSGGECSLQKDFLIPLFDEAHKMGLTCFIDSNGTLDFEENKEFTDSFDMCMLDVKAFNEEYHKELCGMSNKTVIKNLHYLLKIGKLYEVRTVIIPGRDEQNEETVKEVSKIIGDKCIYKIIKYRPFGVRQEMLDKLSLNQLSDEEADKYLKLAQAYGATNARLI